MKTKAQYTFEKTALDLDTILGAGFAFQAAKAAGFRALKAGLTYMPKAQKDKVLNLISTWSPKKSSSNNLLRKSWDESGRLAKLKIIKAVRSNKLNPGREAFVFAVESFDPGVTNLRYAIPPKTYDPAKKLYKDAKNLVNDAALKRTKYISSSNIPTIPKNT